MGVYIKRVSLPPSTVVNPTPTLLFHKASCKKLAFGSTIAESAATKEYSGGEPIRNYIFLSGVDVRDRPGPKVTRAE